MGLTSCATSSHANTQSTDAFTSASADGSTATAGTQPSLTEAGTFAAHGTGSDSSTSVDWDWSVGQPTAGPVPQELVSSCNIIGLGDSGWVWLPVSATVTFHGAVDTTVSMSTSTSAIITPGTNGLDLSGGGTAPDVAMALKQPSGDFACDDVWEAGLSPEQSVEVTGYVAVPVIANDHPSFLPGDTKTWAFAVAPQINGELLGASDTSGANAATCDDHSGSSSSAVVFLYSQPPLSYSGDNGTVSCT